MHRVRVWDLPTRLFHWALVLCVAGLVVSGNLGGNWMEWHLRLGYAALVLLLFRLLWGVVGGRWSRFASFVYSPLSVWRHLRGQGDPLHHVGHNPLGAFSVWAMLAVLLVQVGTGLVSDDEIAFFGPLVRFVSYDTAMAATQYHKGWGKLALLGLIVLHVLALLFYHWVKRERLVAAMVSGDKQLPHPAPSAADGPRERLLALVLLGLSSAVVWWVVRLGTVV
ncbi:cytochrome b/b6 domain-containing protein [Macromonas bipunctata]|uniref:cytochrome b/b6 domain-containing protein n=1 Tax=Macromonas bipunctata TaxID=183670 RepID=UPI000C34E608|nr:cytochrome b/b6 domain-containing protein [Macromonas bipunctata]